MARALPAAAVLLLLLAAAAAPRLVLSCTSIIVGSRATADGSVLISRSDGETPSLQPATIWSRDVPSMQLVLFGRESIAWALPIELSVLSVLHHVPSLPPLFWLRTDGDDYFTANNLVYHPARDEPALLKSNLNKFEIVLPAPGLAYYGLPNIPEDEAQGRNATGEATGVNSAVRFWSTTFSNLQIYGARTRRAACGPVSTAANFFPCRAWFGQRHGSIYSQQGFSLKFLYSLYTILFCSSNSVIFCRAWRSAPRSPSTTQQRRWQLTPTTPRAG